MAHTPLSEKVLLLESALSQARISHAFGGAIALAYYATPRGTIDIDLNLFVDTGHADDVLELLSRLGGEPLPPDQRRRLQSDGQTTVRWDRTPVDLFFAYDPLHESCMERRRRVPFGDADTIHVLSVEDLIVFKVIFDRDKDWRDIEEIDFAMPDEIDDAYVAHWLEAIIGRDDPRFERLTSLRRGDRPAR